MTNHGHQSVVIGIGRNIGSIPMHDRAWTLFRADLRACLSEVVADVHGHTTESDWGEEQSYWLAGLAVSLPVLEGGLADLARRYGQEAIALTTGTTRLVQPAVEHVTRTTR